MTMRFGGVLALAAMGASATIDRLLLAMHGHSSYAWVYIYGIFYTMLIWLHARHEVHRAQAIHYAAETVELQNEIVQMQHEKIGELERCLAKNLVR